MLVQFKIQNFLSFYEERTFSMVASSIREHEAANLYEVDKSLKLLKSAVVYGANSSGKSNLCKAMRFMRFFVINSSKDRQAEEPIPVRNFRLNSACDNKPSSFEMVFIQEGVRYRYGFEATQKYVSSEWLFRVVPKKRKEELLFCRERQEYELGREYQKTKDITQRTRDNALFLSVDAQFNGIISLAVLKWFRNLVVISGLEQRWDEAITLSGNKEYIDSEFLPALKIIDAGIESIAVEKIDFDLDQTPEIMKQILHTLKKLNSRNVELPNETFKINLMRRKYDDAKKFVSVEKFDLINEESMGTQKYFGLLSPVIRALKNSQVLVVDELESSLHPIMTRHLVQMFHAHDGNTLPAQLIFNTHDTNLLNKNLFRRDQIWFTEKNRYGATELYSLIEYKVRNDASFQKDYLEGRYGAVPFIGNAGPVNKFCCCENGNEYGD